jgi:hypothetical protein
MGYQVIGFSLFHKKTHKELRGNAYCKAREGSIHDEPPKRFDHVVDHQGNVWSVKEAADNRGLTCVRLVNAEKIQETLDAHTCVRAVWREDKIWMVCVGEMSVPKAVRLQQGSKSKRGTKRGPGAIQPSMPTPELSSLDGSPDRSHNAPGPPSDAVAVPVVGPVDSDPTAQIVTDVVHFPNKTMEIPAAQDPSLVPEQDFVVNMMLSAAPERQPTMRQRWKEVIEELRSLAFVRSQEEDWPPEAYQQVNVTLATLSYRGPCERPPIRNLELCKLRVLYTYKNDEGLPEMYHEIQKIQELSERCASDGESHMHIDVRSITTHDDLLQALTANNYHIFHYSGHGDDGTICTEPALPYTMLTEYLVNNCVDLRLVFLNACGAPQDVSWADTLHEKGIYLIRFPGKVSDIKATAIGPEFYECILDGEDDFEAACEQAKDAVDQEILRQHGAGPEFSCTSSTSSTAEPTTQELSSADCMKQPDFTMASTCHGASAPSTAGNSLDPQDVMKVFTAGTLWLNKLQIRERIATIKGQATSVLLR